MMDLSHAEHQIQRVSNFKDLVSRPFHGAVNAMCWRRKLTGDFSEIVAAIPLNGNMEVLDPEELRELQLSEQGQRAREILLNDLKVLEEHGASPILNLISCYARDDSYPFFPTDVYSFHVDRAPVPTDTFLCTYHGESSELLPNAHATQKVLVPEIRDELKKLYDGAEEGFEAFLREFFFDLHYQPNPNAQTISCGLGHLWRLACDSSESPVPPCIHRAPIEKPGETRLMMIC